ncbi:MAG: hypothetical protein ACP6IP_02385 [Candidatus Njordarchaeia archaeon]
MFKRKKKNVMSANEILNIAKEYRDLIDLRGNLNPSELRQLLRAVAKSVAGLPESERDRIARQIDEIFDEKVSIRRGWMAENTRKIKSLLHEIQMAPNKKDPMLKTKIMRAQQLDLQIRMDNAMIEAMLQVKEMLMDTVRRAMEPTEAWANVTRLTGAITNFTEEMMAMKEEYEETVSDITADVDNLMATYGVAPRKEVEEKEAALRELIQRYADEEEEEEKEEGTEKEKE